MNSNKKKNRRQFLKNTSLAALSLGLSSKLEARSSEKLDERSFILCDKTTLDYYGEGPFYTDYPPLMIDHQLASKEEAGERMIISGRVFSLDCTQFLPDTIVDVWHASHEGKYDNDSYNLRGVTKTNSQGFYMFETIKPGKYLNGRKYRPSHIHFKIKPPEFSTLTTQLYFEGDTDIDHDRSASITSGQYDATNRIIPLTKNEEGILEGTWDIIINGEGITGTNDMHLDKGMIYELNPSPFCDELIIKYGVFRSAEVSLLVYDMEGKEVAKLEQHQLEPEKYEAVWKPDELLPDGHYFIALKINDLQVHYQKTVRKK